MSAHASDRAASPRVFINCPFDADFGAQRDAIVFTCVYAGFYPVFADSGGQSGRPRLDRILAALQSCRYSIHDLSRCRGEGPDNFARFNMPLELGMAMALRRSPERDPPHEYLILVPDEMHAHQRYVSDLAGLDPQTHDGSAARVATEVLAWLLTAAEAPAQIGPTEVTSKLPDFAAALIELRTEWGGGTLPWARVVEVATRIVRGL